jgi:hypothetical protein
MSKMPQDSPTHRLHAMITILESDNVPPGEYAMKELRGIMSVNGIDPVHFTASNIQDAALRSRNWEHNGVKNRGSKYVKFPPPPPPPAPEPEAAPIPLSFDGDALIEEGKIPGPIVLALLELHDDFHKAQHALTVKVQFIIDHFCKG